MERLFVGLLRFRLESVELRTRRLPSPQANYRPTSP